MQRKKLFFRQLTALLLAASLMVSGCRSNKTDTSDTDSADSQVSAAEQEFQKIIDELFYDQVTSSGLNLHMTLAHPENYGITEFPATFGDYSLEGMKKDYQEMEELQKQLQALDRDSLTSQSQQDYDILMSYLNTEIPGEEYLLYGYPFATVNGMQTDIPLILAEYNFAEKQDVDNYLTLLAEIDECFSQLLTFTQEQEKAGIYLSDLTIDGILESCQTYLDAPESGILAETFVSRLDGLTLTDEERESYIAQNEEILKKDFTAAYTLLSDGLQAMKGHMEYPVSTASLPNGKAYYEYLLNSVTYTSYKDPEKLIDAIWARMQTELYEIYQLLDENTNLYSEIDDVQFTITDPAEALKDLQLKIQKDFPKAPDCTYELRQVPEALEEYTSPAFYLIPPIDSQDQNYIYINQSRTGTRMPLYPVMAHEGYPGHLYQTNYFNAQNDSKLRSILDFVCYVEGWASYVECQSYYWDDHISAEAAGVLAMDNSINMALSAIVDYQVNYEGLSLEELGEFLDDAFQITSKDTVLQVYQTVCEDPANYMKYYVGYLEITEMREYAEDTLGEKFDLQSFHKFLLDFGPAPFGIIREHLDEWLESQQLEQ